MFKVNNKDTITNDVIGSSVSTVKFEQVNVGWKETLQRTKITQCLGSNMELFAKIVNG